MRKIIASTFVSLDGVMQAPGGPEEDTSENFALGGWTFGFEDAWEDISAAGFDAKGRELLLGCKTYDIFASYWPQQSDEYPIAKIFNATKKHVASRTLKSLKWNNSFLLGDDIVSAITALKSQAGADLQIIGSGNMIQTLQTATLIDQYNVWIYPVVLGAGKRLFINSAKPAAFHLVASKVSASGVCMNTYVPAGDIKLGTVG